jgi:hypothetical protein
MKAENVFGGSVGRNYGDLAVMIVEQAQDVLLDAVIVGHDAELFFGSSAGFTHLLGPGRSDQVDGTFLPIVRLVAGDTAGELLAGHGGKLLRFVDELIGGCAVGRDHAAKRADLANVKNQRAGVDIPDDGDFMAIEIELSGFAGTPVGRKLRKLADDEGFDIWAR